MSNSPARASIAPLLAVNFVGTLGFSIVTPFLVILVNKWGGNAIVYGVVAATYSVFQLIGAPILGNLSDRIGRKRVLLLSQFGTLLSWGLFLVAFALPVTSLVNVESAWMGSFVLTLPLLVLFLARAADGLTGGNVSVANAYLADITSETDRTRNFGRMAVTGNLGFIVGPALAGVLGATVLGEVLPVIAAFGISAIALALIQYGLVDLPPRQVTQILETPTSCDIYGHEQKPAYEVECVASGTLSNIVKLPNMPVLLAVNFLIMLGFSFFYVAFPVHAVEVLGWDVAWIGTYLAVLSLMMVVVQGPVLSRASKMWNDRILMVAGGVSLSLGFAALGYGSAGFIYSSAFLIAVGNGLMWPTFMAVLSKSAGEILQGAVQGVAQSIGAVGSVAGLVAGGVLYVQLSDRLFPIAALVIALGTVLIWTYRSPTSAAEMMEP